MQTPSTREIADTEVRDEERRDIEHDEVREEPRDEVRDDPREVRDEPRDEVREERPSSTADLHDDTPELLSSDDNAEFKRRWESIQTGFVDEPRQTVEQADELVAHVMKRLAEGFATEREQLEQQWGRGEDVSTEDLRITLQRYRGFFERLLAA